MSLFSDYMKERLGHDTIEESFGFIVYHLYETSCEILEIFVEKERRDEGLASGLADRVSDLARAKGCNTLFCSVIPGAGSSTLALLSILHYGFQVQSAENGRIILTKDIGG